MSVNMKRDKKTESNEDSPTRKTAKPQDFVKARGVGLASSEWAEFDKVAQELGMKPHALRVYAMRYFMQNYKTGDIQTKTEKVTTLPNID